MSAGEEFWFTPKRLKAQCSNCDHIFTDDYPSRHITNHKPTFLSAGKNATYPIEKRELTTK